MKINYDEFEILTKVEKNNNKIKEENIKNSENIISKLIENNLITKSLEGNLSITEDGYKTLEPYRVKRAIIHAAGKGTRMLPITKDIPKPMVKVNGKRIIDTILDAVKEAGIDEVFIVRGYLSNKFDDLLEKYPNIKFVENNNYETENTISSAYVTREYCENAYIFDADLILKNKNLIKKYEFTSNYVGKYIEETSDFAFGVTGKEIIEYGRGGKDCYLMYGIAYFDKEAGKNFKTDIEKVYNCFEGKQKYFDEVNLKDYKQNYHFMIKECYEDDIIEVDTYEELKQIDSSYI